MNDEEVKSTPTKVELYKHDGATFCSITAKIGHDGTLVISGYDIGPMCQEVYSHDDVESEVIVAPKDKDHLLLALIEEKFGGDSQASGHFREFLDSKKVNWELETWPRRLTRQHL